jgi:hypothetical protein
LKSSKRPIPTYNFVSGDLARENSESWLVVAISSEEGGALGHISVVGVVVEGEDGGGSVDTISCTKEENGG